VAVVVVVLVVVGGVAGDQDPGHRPVTAQPPTRLGIQGSGLGVAAHRAGAALQAVQVHQHRQLGPDPTSLGEAAALQLTAGQLGQGIGGALAAAAVVLGAVGAGQGFQGGQQGLAGLGLQQPVDDHHALEGGGQPHPPILMAPLGAVALALWVGHQPQMPQEPPQPGWVQPPGGIHQHGFGLGGDVEGEVLGAGGQHGGVGSREVPVGHGLGRRSQGAAEQGPGGPHGTAGRGRAHAEPAAEPAGGGGGLDALVGAGGAAGVDPSEFGQPVAFQTVQQPPQDQHPLGPNRIRHASQILGDQLIDQRGQAHQTIRRMCVRVHGGNLSTHHQKASTIQEMWTTSPRPAN